jgi:hypothetical protein
LGATNARSALHGRRAAAKSMVKDHQLSRQPCQYMSRNGFGAFLRKAFALKKMGGWRGKKSGKM